MTATMIVVVILWVLCGIPAAFFAHAHRGDLGGSPQPGSLTAVTGDQR
ncbi:hypothetical protein FHR72_001152 [Mycolicibacterium iranicum]|uniref:Uncharacterized protein n=1 Tax=Mycolicibacterium iranicum TaxID=912594 RepID=A0A839Q1K0_MYCIR|nr:hypothetical protein [Mycolicibacterium iranicum]MBB2989689.1 hypothetical protein [Mycolicibacterium iranicum]